MTYEIEVETVTNTQNDGHTNTIANSNTTSASYSWDWYQTPSTSWYYYSPIYMYQLTCPRCKKMNWGQLDQITECSGNYKGYPCKAKIKAVSRKVDYEVEVG